MKLLRLKPEVAEAKYSSGQLLFIIRALEGAGFRPRKYEVAGNCSLLAAFKKEGKKMGVTDPLADMFTIIRNANRAKIEKVELPSSKLKLQILNVLKKEGYIKNYKHIADNRQGIVKVYLNFEKGKAVLTDIRRISRPGLRVYVPKDKIPRVLRGMGIAIISTCSGVLTDRQARQQGLGGEVICYVW